MNNELFENIHLDLRFEQLWNSFTKYLEELNARRAEEDRLGFENRQVELRFLQSLTTPEGDRAFEFSKAEDQRLSRLCKERSELDGRLVRHLFKSVAFLNVTLAFNPNARPPTWPDANGPGNDGNEAGGSKGMNGSGTANGGHQSSGFNGMNGALTANSDHQTNDFGGSNGFGTANHDLPANSNDTAPIDPALFTRNGPPARTGTSRPGYFEVGNKMGFNGNANYGDAGGGFGQVGYDHGVIHGEQSMVPNDMLDYSGGMGGAAPRGYGNMADGFSMQGI
jgi:hypothetical protein